MKEDRGATAPQSCVGAEQGAPIFLVLMLIGAQPHRPHGADWGASPERRVRKRPYRPFMMPFMAGSGRARQHGHRRWLHCDFRIVISPRKVWSAACP